MLQIQVAKMPLSESEVDSLLKPLSIKDLRIQTRVRNLSPAGVARKQRATGARSIRKLGSKVCAWSVAPQVVSRPCATVSSRY